MKSSRAAARHLPSKQMFPTHPAVNRSGRAGRGKNTVGPVDILVNNAGVIEDDLFVAETRARNVGTRYCGPTWGAPTTFVKRLINR